MTNAMIVLLESVKLMEAGLIAGSGIKGTTPDGKEIELPEAIHTYATWKSLGYQVKKGEKAIAKFPIWKQGKASKKAAEEARANGEDAPQGKMFMKTAAWFTIGQVEKIEQKEAVS